MLSKIKGAFVVVVATIGLVAINAVPAHADQNDGYSAAYHDPHDQDEHSDLPKPFGEFGYDVAKPSPSPEPTTAGGGGIQTQASIPCPSGKFCTYRNTFWWGEMYYYTLVNGPYPVCVHIGGTWNNDIESVRNYASRAVRLHNDPNCGNSWDSFTVYPGSSVDFGGLDQRGNQVSSFQWL